MSVTQRVSIQWGAEQASEPTDTLVLTSAEGRFVDIRVTRAPKPGDKFPIDWAFCGEAKTLDDGRVHFTHDIDSNIESEPDIGAIEQLANGDERETGVGINSETGKREPYVEVWRPLDPNKETRTPQPKSLGADISVSVLATVEGQQVNGRVVRVGQWQQGILEYANQSGEAESAIAVHDRIAVVRARSTGDIWSKEITAGTHASKLPVRDLDGHVLGDTFYYGGIEWAVIEHRRPLRGTPELP